jgi:hypothetical protein
MLRLKSVSPLAAAVIVICVILIAATYTAHASHLATQGGWPPPFDLSQSGDSTSRDPGLALAENGDLHVTWMEPAGVTYTVYHAASQDQGNSWSYSVPMSLSLSGNDRVEAAIDVDAYGRVHTVWVERYPAGAHELWYAMLSGDNWEEMFNIAHTDYVTYIVAPDVVSTPDFVHAVWSQTNAGAKWDVFYSRSEAGGSWSEGSCTVETSFSSQYPRMAEDPAGNLHVVWEENNSPPAVHQIYYISGTVGYDETVWSTPVTVSVGLTQTSTTPDVEVGSDYTVHVVFGVNVPDQEYVQDIYYASFPVTDVGVVSPTLIPGSRVKVSQQLPTFASPAVALFGTDQVHIAWNGWRAGDYSDSDRIYYAVSDDGGLSWSQPVPVSPKDSWPDGFPSLAADPEFVHVVWQEKVSGTDQDIYYTRRFPIRFPFPLAMKTY